MLRFDGQVALITGAAGGLGHCWSQILHSRGAACILVDIDPRVLEQHAPSVSSTDGSLSRWDVIVANCASERECRHVVDQIYGKHGRIDILVHASTLVQDAAFRKMTQAQWATVLEHDLTSAFTMTRAVWSAMREQNYGRIVLCTSASGLYGNFGQVRINAILLIPDANMRVCTFRRPIMQRRRVAFGVLPRHLVLKGGRTALV
jgi:NAD(P)-dependent dehydrogenase (short-subunit alcohol dehydrogenase family)